MTTFSIQHKIEVQFVPGGSFIDISTRSRDVVIDRPRATVDTMVEATTVTIVLDNTPATAAEVTAWSGPTSAVGYSPFTPSNPAGAFSPNLGRDRMIRVTYTWNAGANTSVRFFGWSDKWVPDMSDDPAQATVTLTGSCLMSRYARRDLISDYGEKITSLAGNDYWPFDDPADSVYLRGLSLDRTDIPPAQVIQSNAGTGTLALGKPDATILVDGAATFASGDANTVSSPVILVKTRGRGSGWTTVGRVSAWVKLDADTVGVGDDLFAAYNYFGEVVWRMQAVVVSGVVVWRLVDGLGTMRSQQTTTYPRDDTWHWISVLLYDDSGTPASAIAIRDKTVPDRIVSGYIPGWPQPPWANIEYIVVGGNMNPRAAGKQGNTMNGSISGLWVDYHQLQTSWSFLSAAGVPFTGFERAQHLVQYGAVIDTLAGGGVGGSDADTTPVQLTGENATLLDAWREHVRTIQGRIFTRPDGRRHVRVPSAVNPATVNLTLDVEADLHMPAGGFASEQAERPTRQTVNSPIGSVTLIDQVTETATGLRLAGSDIESAAGDTAVARGLAYRQMIGDQPRMTSFGFDVTLMPSDQRTAVLALVPWHRIRLTNLPAPQLGLTYFDVWASGWSEHYLVADQSLWFEFDTDPADDPPEGVFDDAEYGRFALGDSGHTITSGTCVGNTGTGTVVLTSTSPLTTNVADYPLDLDWNGERITISGVGGATSPQTCTVTARGVAPTVARVHATGEAVEVWHAMRFGA